MKPTLDQIKMQRWWILQDKLEKNLVTIPPWMAFLDYDKGTLPLTWVFTAKNYSSWEKTLRGHVISVFLWDSAVVRVFKEANQTSGPSLMWYEIADFLGSVFKMPNLILLQGPPTLLKPYQSYQLHAHITKQIGPYHWILVDHSDLAIQARHVIRHAALQALKTQGF
jgi:hypothetical protein